MAAELQKGYGRQFNDNGVYTFANNIYCRTDN